MRVSCFFILMHRKHIKSDKFNLTKLRSFYIIWLYKVHNLEIYFMGKGLIYYRTFVKDGVINEIPIVGEESKVLIEMNYQQYANLLAEIIMKTSNTNVSSSENELKKIK